MAIQIKMPKAGGRTSWHHAIRTSLNPETAAAFTFFRTALGEDWPGWADGAPLANTFFTALQNSPAECVRLHRMIRALEGTDSLDIAVSRDIGSPSWTDYVAAVMALEFCSRFRTFGHAVELIRPDQQQRRPDARVILTDRWVTFEFKGLHDPDGQAPWDTLVDRVASGLWEHSIELSSLDVELAEGALANPVAVVDGLLAVHASQIRDFEELPSRTGRARIAEGLGRYSTPVVQDDDVTRIAKKLLGVTWSRQLATITGATLLAARSKDIFDDFGYQYVMDHAAEVSSIFALALSLRPEISAILVYEEPLLAARPPFSVEAAGFRVSVGASDGGHARVAILVPNPAAKVPLTIGELELLIGDRMRW